jgi:hypothetical protein
METLPCFEGNQIARIRQTALRGFHFRDFNIREARGKKNLGILIAEDGSLGVSIPLVAHLRLIQKRQQAYST